MDVNPFQECVSGPPSEGEGDTETGINREGERWGREEIERKRDRVEKDRDRNGQG